MANAIGIDFGTTKTMVSFLNPVTGKAELVRLGRDRDSIPTTVHQDENGELLFGEDADDLIETDPEGYCRAFKLHLGENDPVILRSGVTATTLTRRFLSHIKDECEQNVFHGKRIDAATITIPVSFSPSRKAALTRAAEGAGFTSVSFMPEPEAAGKAFLRDNPSDSFSRALVLDWGGGTLDIAIISRGEDGTIHADRHCAEGRDDVGGEEMDRGLLVNLDAMWSYGYGVSLLTEEENEPMLLREAEKVKIGLSRKDVVPFRRGPKKIDVSRDKFNRIISELIDAAINLVNSALSKNKALGNPDPEAILLIGGASQLPVVREVMEQNFPKLKVLSWHHSHEAVALGATEVETGRKSPIVEPSPEERVKNDFRTASDALDEVLAHAGDLAENGDLTKLSKSDADIIAKVAGEGNIRAANILGLMYSVGCEGYPRDNAKALNWETIAANAGDNDSQAMLATWFLGDENSPAQRDSGNALKWAEMAQDGNNNLMNRALLMVVLSQFDEPDTERIKHLGNSILGEVGDNAPSTFTEDDRLAIGTAYYLLAINSLNSGEYESGVDYLHHGVDFEDQNCIDTLREMEEETNSQSEMTKLTPVPENIEWHVVAPLAAKVADSDYPATQTELDFMNRYFKDAFCKGIEEYSAWKEPSPFGIDELACNVRNSYANSGNLADLTYIFNLLQGLVECDGPANQAERDALSWIKFIFGIDAESNNCFHNTTNGIPFSIKFRKGTFGGYVMEITNNSAGKVPLHIESHNVAHQPVNISHVLFANQNWPTGIGWIELKAGRNFRPGETGSIFLMGDSTVGYKFEIDASGNANIQQLSNPR